MIRSGTAAVNYLPLRTAWCDSYRSRIGWSGSDGNADFLPQIFESGIWQQFGRCFL
jgi:hypothetical protein